MFLSFRFNETLYGQRFQLNLSYRYPGLNIKNTVKTPSLYPVIKRSKIPCIHSCERVVTGSKFVVEKEVPDYIS